MSTPCLLLLTWTSTASAQALPEMPLELSKTLTGSWPGSDYGAVLVAAGDVDLNGKPDLLVGAPFDAGDGVNRGRAVLYLGDRDNSGYTGESWTVVGTRDRGHYGGSLAGGADLDGDGFSDIVVASSYQDWQVDLYTGGEAGPAATADWSVNGSGGTFGHSLDLVGDMDGDGYAELAIGNSYGGEYGEVIVYLGGAGGPQDDPVVLSGDAEHPVGAIVARAGDVDGDGLADLLSGTGSDVETPSAVVVFRGDAAGPVTTVAYSLIYPGAAAGFGGALAGAQDIDGDGLSDLVVGADGVGPDSSGLGRVYGYAGSVGGPATAASWLAEDAVSGTILGRALAMAGDVDGDGFGDVLAGRPGFEEGQELEGGAALFMGSASGMASDPAWRGSSDLDASDHGGVWIGYGQAVAGLGDLDGDEYDDVAIGAPNTGADSYEGRLGSVSIYTGTPYRPPAEPQDTGADTGGDTGDAQPDGGGCGCSGAPSSALLTLLPALLGLAWRRR